MQSTMPGHIVNARNDAAKKSAIALVLAASLAASAVHAAENVERADDATKPADTAKDTKRDVDARLEDAQRRLEQAASEVAALSAEMASQVVENIAASFPGSPRRTVIGVQLAPGTAGGGAKVQAVSPGGPAEQAGIRTGDVIVAVNGQEVKGEATREVVRILRSVEPESTVKVRVLRDGKPKEFDVIARPFDPGVFTYRTSPPPGFHSSPNPGPGFDPDAISGRFGSFNFSDGLRSEIEGMELTTLTPQLGRYFGTDKGVLVVRAPENDVFKLQDGDVIISIDGRSPTSGSHITRILRSYQPGEKLTLRVLRDRKPLDLEITLPNDGRPGRIRASRLEMEAEPALDIVVAAPSLPVTPPLPTPGDRVF